MQKKDPIHSAADILQKLFEKGDTPLSGQFVRWKLWSRWSEFVGNSVAAQCEPVSYFRGTLWIWVKNSTWHQQMVFIKNDMIKNINERLQMEYVTEIKFTLNKRDIPVNEDAAIAKQNINRFNNR